jgi:E3 ubiquitin-protein ligase RNF144
MTFHLLYHFSLDPIVICGGCGAKSCYKHEVIWHEGQTCKDYDESKKQPDFATNAYLSRTTKTCPMCTMHIEKNEGCNHMTCKCSYQFCWL